MTIAITLLALFIAGAFVCCMLSDWDDEDDFFDDIAH